MEYFIRATSNEVAVANVRSREDADYLLTWTEQKIHIGTYTDVVDGRKVLCVDEVGQSAHRASDLFIKKARFAEEGVLIAERIEYINKSILKGICKDGVLKSIPQFF